MPAPSPEITIIMFWFLLLNKKKVSHPDTFMLCLYDQQLTGLKVTPLSRDSNTEDESLPTLEAEELSALNKKDIQVEITVQEEKLAQMKPNMAAIAEYRKKV